MTDTQYRQALALFRYGLIAEFIQLPAGSRGLYARLRDKARAEYTIPGSTRTRVAPETLRHWLKDYRRGGFDALLPKGTQLIIKLLSISPQMLEQLILTYQEFLHS